MGRTTLLCPRPRSVRRRTSHSSKGVSCLPVSPHGHGVSLEVARWPGLILGSFRVKAREPLRTSPGYKYMQYQLDTTCFRWLLIIIIERASYFEMFVSMGMITARLASSHISVSMLLIAGCRLDGRSRYPFSSSWYLCSSRHPRFEGEEEGRAPKSQFRGIYYSRTYTI